MYKKRWSQRACVGSYCVATKAPTMHQRGSTENVMSLQKQQRTSLNWFHSRHTLVLSQMSSSGVTTHRLLSGSFFLSAFDTKQLSAPCNKRPRHKVVSYSAARKGRLDNDVESCSRIEPVSMEWYGTGWVRTACFGLVRFTSTGK